MTNKKPRCIKNCIICNKEFESMVHKNFQTCGSNSCRAKYGYLKRSELRYCKICGKEFRKAKSSNQYNCELHRRKEYINCANCNKKVLVKIGTKCCSAKCAANYAKLKHMTTVHCSNCNKVIHRSSMFIAKNKNQFCDKVCQNIYYEKHYDIKRYPSHYGETWWFKRLDALNRDNHCLMCGSQKSLQVHHFKKMKTFNKPDDAHFIDNLGTFCKTCHYKVEKLNYLSYSDYISKNKKI